MSKTCRAQCPCPSVGEAELEKAVGTLIGLADLGQRIVSGQHPSTSQAGGFDIFHTRPFLLPSPFPLPVRLWLAL